MLLVAKYAGFCFGVRRAVNVLEDACTKAQPVATLGSIIHNPVVVREFAGRGVRMLNSASEAMVGERVVIRAHGASPAEIEEICARGALVEDATCPCLTATNEIIGQASRRETVIMVGDGGHPEVLAALSRAPGESFAVRDAIEARGLPNINAALVLAQSTLDVKVWEEVIAVLRKIIPNLRAERTRCNATSQRQAEAREIAMQADAMIVVGGSNSANTMRLVDICGEYCLTFRVTEASEIPVERLRGFGIIGITAGASTPDEIIKEVVTVMSELDNMNKQEQENQPCEAVQEAVVEANEPQETDGKDTNFMTEFEKTMVSIRPGQFVTGTVVQITEDEVCVNIGYKSDGIIPLAELSTDEDPRKLYKIGDELEVEVVKVNDGEGNVLLSQRSFIAMKNWGVLVEKHENNEYVEGVGKSVVKGGLICDVQGVRTFVPASQLAERYVEKIEQFIGQTMKLKIIEVDKPKRRFVASRKAVLVEEGKKLREELWEKLQVGATVHGIVRRLTDFGAFVDIGGMDGLVHVTDLSWGRVRHPSDVVKPNDEIDVAVLAVDRERNRISLGLKQLQARPWDNAAVNYPVGSVVEGKVVRMVTFGAFIELEPGLDGLVHISQISDVRINKVEDALSVGQMVKVKVLDVNPEEKRISLSIREARGSVEQHDDLNALPSDLGDAILAHSTAEEMPVDDAAEQE